MKIRPLFDRVVVEEEKEDTTKSGIFLGHTNAENIRIGKVLYVGPGNQNDDGETTKMFVSPGDRVLFSKFSCAEANLDKELVLIMRQTDILAVIE